MSGILINSYRYGAATDARCIMKWTTTSGSQVITLWNQQGGTNNYDVDWGDGSSESGITALDKTHTYTVAGTYEVKITGKFAGLNMHRGSATDQLALAEFSNWGTSEIDGCYRMFYNCENMLYTATDSPDLSNMQGSYKTQFREMFYDCQSITSLDLSGWTVPTSTWTSTGYAAFYNLHSCTSFNLSGWDIRNATSMQNFATNLGKNGTGCVVNCANINASAVTNMAQAFKSAKVTSIDVSNWVLKPSGTVSASSIFNDLTRNDAGDVFNLDLSTWTNTSSLTSASTMFRDGEFDVLNLTNWDTSNITSWALMWYGCANLTKILGLNGLSCAGQTSNTFNQMFSLCRKLGFNDSDTSNFDDTLWGANTNAVTRFDSCFNTVGETTPGTHPPNVSNWDTSACTNFGSMFKNMAWTTGTLDVSGFDVSAATNLGSMFYGMQNPIGTTIDTSSWQISNNVTSLGSFIRGSNITTLDLSHVGNDFSNITTFTTLGYQSKLERFILNATLTEPGFTSVTGSAFSNFFPASGYATVATSDYDELLLKLDNGGQSNVTLYAGASTYTSGGAVATARANLIGKGWSITDGGGCCFSNALSVEFDGVDDYVDCGNISEIQNASKVTISFWAKLDSFSYNVILGQDLLSGTDNFQFYLWGATPILYIWIKSGNVGTVSQVDNATFTSLVNIGEWNYYTIVFDGTQANDDRCKLHINGSSDVITTRGTMPTTFTNSSESFLIGRGTSGYGEGNIDEVSIFDSALSSADVTTIYNSGVPNDLSSLNPVLWYRMGDDDTYPTLIDRGSGGNDGTMTNMVSGDIVSNPAFSNILSVEFDGVDDYVGLGTNLTDLKFTDAFTLSCWVKFNSLTGIQGILEATSEGAVFGADGYLIWKSSGNKIQFYIRQGASWKIATSTTTVTTGTWYHIGATWDGVSTSKIYINGTEEDSNATITSITYPTTTSHNIGGYQSKSGSPYIIDGLIDEVSFYNGLENINDIYNGGTPNNLSDLSPVAWYRMGDGDTYPTLTDHGSGGNNGTMTNMTSGDIVSDVP